MFDYDKNAALNVRVIGARQEEGYHKTLLVYEPVKGVRRVGELFIPEGEGPFPAILYVHWYKPPHPTSNRSQFVEEAKHMAQKGAASLLIETLWSDYDFFLKRTQQDDEVNSTQAVIEIRRAMDLLLSQPQVDASRFCYVGHDFGAMYGALAGSHDPRPTAYVLMAGTPRFSDWYLYAPNLEGEARENFIRQMDKFDPIHAVGKLSPIYFQFGNDDFHVPVERAREFFDAACEPKKISWYECGHGLNETATQDRMAWVAEHLRLGINGHRFAGNVRHLTGQRQQGD